MNSKNVAQVDLDQSRRSEIEKKVLLAGSRISGLPTDKIVHAGTLLKILSEEGLLELDFLHGDTAEIEPDDIEQACWTLEFLVGVSAAAASAYMANAVLASAVITVMGTSDQKQSLLRRMRSGDLQLAFAMTEPNAGSDAASMTTTCRKEHDGFLLSGDKIYTTGAATADEILVVARHSTGDTKDRLFSIFVVSGNAPGLTVVPLDSLARHIHASCEVALRDVRVPETSILGGANGFGKAWAFLRRSGALERLVVAFMARGLARPIVKRAIEFGKQREQFGQPISKYQAIQHMLVEMTVIEHAMQLFCDAALSALKSGVDPTKEILMAKYVCSEQLQRLASYGMRILGGRAYFDFEEMARYYREAPFSLYAGGTVEIHKMLISRAIGI